MAFLKEVPGKNKPTFYIIYKQPVRQPNGTVINKKKWLNVGHVKSNAHQALRAFKKEYDANRSKFTLTQTVLFSTFVNESFLPWCKSRKNEKEYARTCHSICLMVGFFGPIRLNDLTTKMIEDYVTWRKERKTRDKSISNRTVNIDLIYLSQCYNKAIEWEVVENNPCKKVSRLKEPKSRVRFFSVEEIGHLIFAANPYIKRLLIVGLSTGMRHSELLNLKLSQIDMVNQTIHITNDETFQTKSGKNRDIPISFFLMDHLVQMMKTWAHPITCEVRPRTSAQSTYLFCNEKGEPLKSFKRSFYSLLAHANVSNATVHTMRHTFASHLVMKGVSIRTVQELLGHSSISVTEMYAHLSSGFKKKEIDLLDYGGLG